MAIQDLGLVVGSARDPQGGVRVYERDDAANPGGRDIRLAWTTMLGSEAQSSFEVTLHATGRRKGMANEVPFKTYAGTVPADQCDEHREHDGGRVFWSTPLSIGRFLADFAGTKGEWDYATRTFDTITVEASVRANWKSDVMGDGSTQSERAYATVYISYMAEYSLARARYESSDTLVIEYSTTWTRQDDRFAVLEASRMAGDGGEPILGKEYWGTIAAPGRIEVPTSALARHVKGKRVLFEVAFNPFYRPAVEGRQTASGELVVGGSGRCDSCTLSVVPSGDPYALWVEVGDAGDLGLPISEATLKAFSADGYGTEATVPVGTTAKLRGCPLNVPLTVEGVGSNGVAASEKATTVSAGAIEARGLAVVDSVADEGLRAVVEYNQSVKVSVEAERDVVKLAGRDRPSSFYGTGGSVSVELSGTLVDDSGAGVERMPERGDAWVRLPDGRVYRCALDASVGWDRARLRKVTLSGKEVGA